MSREISFKVFGNPQSKANSRRLVVNKSNGKVMFIKSKTALSYVQAFMMQCPNLIDSRDGLMDGDLSVQIDIWYESGRSDLDESIILDCMQGRIYKNDRQVKVKYVTHRGIDKIKPRAIIVVSQCHSTSNA